MRTAAWLLAALFGVASAACSAAADRGPPASPATPQAAVSSPPPCSDQASSRGFTVTMQDDRFRPSCLVVGEGFPFHLANHGSTRHNFTIAGTNVSVDVAPGQSVDERALLALGLHTGTYRFYCRFHRSKGMVGRLHVLAA